jgi:hypothetical protein
MAKRRGFALFAGGVLFCLTALLFYVGWTSSRGLYTDAEVERKWLNYDPSEPPNGIPCLDCVPAGKAYARDRVFRDLGLDAKRLRPGSIHGIMAVEFVRWQISPSYDISCMTAINDPENNGISERDPRRKIYGIRIMKRLTTTDETFGDMIRRWLGLQERPN